MPTPRLLNSSKEQKVPAKDHGSVAALLETIELQGSKGSLFKRHPSVSVLIFFVSGAPFQSYQT